MGMGLFDLDPVINDGDRDGFLGADQNDAARATEQLRWKGYFLMDSQALGERIAVIEHDRFRQGIHPGIPVYTLEEIRLLQQGIEAGTIVNIEDLRLLHEAKKRFKGAIIQ